MFSAVIALAALLQPASADCLALDDAVARALETAPGSINAEANREFARAELMAARSRRFPQIGLFGQTGLGNNQPLDQSRDDQVGLSANLELTSFGQRSAAITAARETLRAAEAGEVAAMIDVVETTLSLYIALLRADRLVELTTQQTDGYARDAQTVRSRLERSLITRADARQIEARYAAAIARREEAILLSEEARAELAVFVGIEPRCAAPVESVLSAKLIDQLGAVDREQAMFLAGDQSFALKSARAEKRAAEAELRRAKRAGLPTFSANAFVLGQYDDSTLPIDDRWSQEDRVGFSIRQDLFTGGQLRAERAQGRARVRAADAQLEEERRRIAFTVARSVRGLKQHKVIVDQRRAAALAAEDRLDVTTLELERGTKTITDYVLANEDYYNAAIDEVSAIAERDRALLSLASATGLLADEYEDLFDEEIDRARNPSRMPTLLPRGALP